MREALFKMTTNHLVCAFLRRCISQMKRMVLNQSALAKRMNVSRAYIAKLMSGDVNITFATAAKLARALQMDFFPQLKATESRERFSSLGPDPVEPHRA